VSQQVGDSDKGEKMDAAISLAFMRSGAIPEKLAPVPAACIFATNETALALRLR
jgi:hypothetical protein